MTVEASPVTPELVAPEQLTIATYNDLLYTARSMHFGAQEKETYDHFRVTSHTDSRTIMMSGSYKLACSHLVIEDMQSKGVLLLATSSRNDFEYDRLRKEDAVLLSSYSEQPRMQKIPLHPVFSDGRQLGTHNTDELATILLEEGELLDEKTARDWLEGLQGLLEAHSQRREKAGGIIQRLLRRAA